MRKKMVATTMALTMTALPMTAYAAEPEVTAEQLFQDAAVYLVQADQVQLDLATDNAGSFSLASEGGSSSSFGGAAKGNAQITRTSNPSRVHMKGDMTCGMMGISYKMNGELYLMESEDGENMDLYATMNVGPEAIGWMHEQGLAEEFWSGFDVTSEEEFEKVLTDALGQELPEFSLKWTIEEQEDTYEVSYNKSIAELYQELEAYVAEQGGEMNITEEERELLDEVMSCIVVDAKAVFDKETHALESVKLDLSDSDAAKLGEKITELMQADLAADAEEMMESIEEMAIGLELENAYFEMTCSYENVPEITVPQEVIDEAAQAEESQNAKTDSLTEESSASEKEAEVTETADTEIAETETAETETIVPESVVAEEM